MIRISIAQFNPTVGDLSGNASKILELNRQALKQKTDLLIFPEMAITGYPPEDLLFKDHFVKDNIKALKSVAKKMKNTAVIGFADMDAQKNIYNAAAVITNGKVQGIYHKRALPNYGVFDEKRYFSEGTQNPIFSLNGVNFAVNICEDIWVDGGVYREQSRKGADLIINISCSPFDRGKLRQRERLISQRAKEIKTHICYANIVGGQDELVFDGRSFIVAPDGKMLASAKQFEETMLCADVNIASKSKSQRGKIILKQAKDENRPVIAIEKSKRLSEIEAIYRALVLGTKDYVQKNGFKKVVIGVSGGIDSALVAAIAVDALGKDNVIGVSMPSSYSSKGTKTDAKRLADNLGITFKEISIKETVKAYDRLMKDEFKGLKPNIAEENIQARIRGNILMALSNKFGWLVLTTGNKSEVAVGYCTLYGDMTGGFAVIKDVPKMNVYELSIYRNTLGKTIIPNSIIARAPSAELRANQKDQDSLPDYACLDKIIEGYVANHESYEKLSRIADKKTIRKVIELIDKSEYKRRQGPPGIKITPRAFGKDWRLPITNKYKEF